MDTTGDDSLGDLGLYARPGSPSLILPEVGTKLEDSSDLKLPRWVSGAGSFLMAPSPSLDLNFTIEELHLPSSSSSSLRQGPESIVPVETHPQQIVRPSSALDQDVQPTPLEPTKLERMRRWIVSLAIINFDLEVGPVIDILYPSIELTEAERENIAFSAFPDTALFDTGSEVHSFRIPEGTVPNEDENSSHDIHWTSRPPSIDGYLYGYTLFHQRRDNSSKRGYLQRSVVILSHLPYSSLFMRVLHGLAPLYFSQGAPSLETACHNIANWPDPIPGLSCELGFMGSVLSVELPQDERQQQQPLQVTPPGVLDTDLPILASVPPSDPSPLRIFATCLPKLWSIWECLILCEPLILFAATPREASLAVWWLYEFVRPLNAATDFRPYFHIHDQDFEQVANKNKPRAGLLIGVTNPFFTEVCKHWPHVLSLGHAPRHHHLHHKKDRDGQASKDPDASLKFGPDSGFHSKHQRYISKDRDLIKTLETAIQKGGHAEAEAVHLLRRHFSMRASEVLGPLNRYFTSLVRNSDLPVLLTPSTDTSVSPSPAFHRKSDSIAPNVLGSFVDVDFLTSLRTHGTILPFRSKAKQKEFYERWLKSPAFGIWLAERDADTRTALKGKKKAR